MYAVMPVNAQHGTTGKVPDILILPLTEIFSAKVEAFFRFSQQAFKNAQDFSVADRLASISFECPEARAFSFNFTIEDEENPAAQDMWELVLRTSIIGPTVLSALPMDFNYINERFSAKDVSASIFFTNKQPTRPFLRLISERGPIFTAGPVFVAPLVAAANRPHSQIKIAA